MRDPLVSFSLQETSLQAISPVEETVAPSRPIVIIEESLHHGPELARKLESVGFRSLVQSSWEGPAPELLTPLIVLIVSNGSSTLGEIWDTCRKIKKDTPAPVSVVMTETDTVQRLPGFSMAASDLVLELMNDRQIIRRVHEIVQGQEVPPRSQESHQPKQYGNLVLVPDTHHVLVCGQSVSLTPSEYTILDFLIGWPGRVFHRQELVFVLYGKKHFVVERVIDVHIGNLRRKIECDPSRPTFIESVRGVEYRLKSIDEHQNGTL